MQEVVEIQKLVHGGQGLGTLADGRKVFVWNALPGEHVRIEISKKRRDYAEAIAIEVIEVSPERQEPKDEAYLSTSPWQIMNFDAENTAKQQILAEAMSREGITRDDIPFYAGEQQWHYRNKMEYSFWADDDGLHTALFNRGTHGKRIVNGSSIARPEIDEVAQKMCTILNSANIRGSQLKTVVIRCDQAGNTVVALFVKDENFPKLAELENLCQGTAVCFSNPKSPASVLTKELYAYGDVMLADKVLGKEISYDVHSFFQVNLPIFEQAAEKIQEQTKGKNNIVDMYAGVGTIGIACGADILVDIDQNNTAMAEQNAKQAKRAIEVIQAPSERAMEHITADSIVIVDPPRAGLHKDVTAHINEVKPSSIIYLSCNPSTQARDIALLQENYEIASLEGYNFFPRTPHIESLAILTLKP